LLLLVLIDIDDLLLDVLVGTAYTADLDGDVVVLHVLFGKAASGLGKGGGEHQAGVIRIGVDICGHIKYKSLLIGNAHIPAPWNSFSIASSHPEDSSSSASSITVNLCMSDKVLRMHEDIVDLLEAPKGQQVDVAHEVHQAARRSDEDIAAHLELLALIPRRGTTVDDTGAQHGAVAQATGLIEDLAGKLASRADDQDQRLSTDTISCGIVTSRIRARSCKLACLTHELG
jgi:hypothetical protein